MLAALPMAFCSRVGSYDSHNVKEKVEAYPIYPAGALGANCVHPVMPCKLGSLIKPSFPQPSLKHRSRSTRLVEVIGLATATAFARFLPVSVAGVVFLSGKYFRSLTSSCT